MIERVKAGGDRGRFERMCISMITHPRSNDDTSVLLERLERIKDAAFAQRVGVLPSAEVLVARLTEMIMELALVQARSSWWRARRSVLTATSTCPPWALVAYESEAQKRP